MKAMIRKWLGVASSSEVNDIVKLLKDNVELNELSLKTANEANQLASSVRGGFRQLEENTKVLYGEVSSDIRRVDKKIKAVKPILKVESPEAIKFIKGILSKHDTNMYNNQRLLEDLKNTADIATEKANKAVEHAQESSLKLSNVMNGLGLDTAEPVQFASFKELLIEKSIEIQKAKQA